MMFLLPIPIPDPLKTVNVYNRPEYGAVQAELQEELHGFIQKQVIDWEIPDEAR